MSCQSTGFFTHTLNALEVVTMSGPCLLLIRQQGNGFAPELEALEVRVGSECRRHFERGRGPACEPGQEKPLMALSQPTRELLRPCGRWQWQGAVAEVRAKLPAGCRCPSPRPARGHQALGARQSLHLVFQQLLLCSRWTPSTGKRSLQRTGLALRWV